jgi:hypothetical protein
MKERYLLIPHGMTAQVRFAHTQGATVWSWNPVTAQWDLAGDLSPAGVWKGLDRAPVLVVAEGDVEPNPTQVTIIGYGPGEPPPPPPRQFVSVRMYP